MIAEQARSIEELTSANAGLVERVTALERILGRNSGNSSMSPSSDDLPGRKKPRPRPAKGSGRERGKQNGAPGGSLPWVANPDEHVAHRPDGGCACGADLDGATDVGIDRSHQVQDLPEVHIRGASTTCTGSGVAAGVSTSPWDPPRCRRHRRATG